MKNVILIHSYNGDTVESFAPSIERYCKQNKINYFAPKFPIRKEAYYEKWETILNQYNINKDTIIIAHSLGTQFTLKYLALNDLEINTYISVAGFIDYEGRKDLEEILYRFKPSDNDFEKCKLLIKNRYSIYSDNDELNQISKLEKYADKLNAKKILLKGKGHFNPKSGVKEIIEINEIIGK